MAETLSMGEQKKLPGFNVDEYIQRVKDYFQGIKKPESELKAREELLKAKKVWEGRLELLEQYEQGKFQSEEEFRLVARRMNPGYEFAIDPKIGKLNIAKLKAETVTQIQHLTHQLG